MDKDYVEARDDTLQRLSKYYREVVKAVSASASRVLLNIGAGQRYGTVTDLSILSKSQELLAKQTVVIKKPKKQIERKKFLDEEDIPEGGEELEEELELTDEDIAWSSLNKIWRTQENNPFEKETLIGEYLLKTTANNRRILGPLFTHLASITFDPNKGSFSINKLSEKPDLNTSLIATLLPDDSSSVVRGQISELFLSAESIDKALIKKISDLLSNNILGIKEIEIRDKIHSLNEIAEIGETNLVIKCSVIINTTRTGAFILDDLDELSKLEESIEDTPIEELLTTPEEPVSKDDDEEETTRVKTQEVYFFPLKSNIYQKRACDRVMSDKLTVIWGPPGTGKSETIANLVCHLVANNKSVLVTSQQPKALEVVRDKLKNNITLNVPNHPSQTVPLEMALIRGKKESLAVDELKNRLGALGVYTHGIGSTWEIENKIRNLKKSLIDNIGLQQQLAKRFTELKLEEKRRFSSGADAPTRLGELKDYDLIDITERFSHKDPSINENLIRRFVMAVVNVGKRMEKIKALYGDKLEDLTEFNERVDKIYEDLILAEELLQSMGDEEVLFTREILLNSPSTEESLETIRKVGEIWKDFVRTGQELKIKKIPLGSELRKLTKIEESTFKLLEDFLDSLKKEGKKLADTGVGPEVDLSGLNVNQLEQDLFLLKELRVNLITKIFDKDAKDALQRSIKVLKIEGAGWRNKDLISDQLSALISALKISSTINDLKRELKVTAVFKDDIDFRKIPKLIYELESFIKVGRAIKEISVMAGGEKLIKILERYNDKLPSLENPTDLLTKYSELVSSDFISKVIPQGVESKEFFDKGDLKTFISRARGVKGDLTLLIELTECEKELERMPNTKQRLLEEVKESGYRLPSQIEESGLVIERHRLGQLYGSVNVEESTQAIAARMRELDTKNKHLIHHFLLSVRLKALYEASHEKIAFRNIYRLKTLLGRKTKTLGFLKKKESINFSQILPYFPCWITGIDDVARYFPLTKGLFDYVIIDEASQCSQTAVPHLFYRSKNAVIVGDAKQLPNANLRFLQKGVMDQLQKKYKLNTHERSQFFDCREYSLLNFAESSTPPVELIEHFRCDPTIIEWSNKNVYDNMMKIMTPVWVRRFNPPMEVRYISEGVEDPEMKVNQVEATAVVEELKRVIADRKNDGLTIGVISPFRPQADLISDLIYQQIDPDDIKKFALQSRTVDGFQGDERDIILYSMRYSVNINPSSVTAIEGGVNEEGFKRMNVAFTRARRRAVIFTSTKISDFPGKYIKSFAEHASSVQKNYVDPLNPGDDKFDSKFEEDVCRMLRQRGLLVKTQFPVSNFLVDQVVQDKDGRILAVECDGDFKMDESGDLPEHQYIRQATIERVTQWEVHRITASVFYLNPEAIIESVIGALNRQPTIIEKERESDTRSTEAAIGLATEESGAPTEEEQSEEVMGIVESEEVSIPPTEKVPSPSRAMEIYKKQIPLLGMDFEEKALDKNLWFSIAHWGKITGSLTSFQNRFCYSIGLYISKNGRLTEKQKAYAKTIYEITIGKGFTRESIDSVKKK